MGYKVFLIVGKWKELCPKPQLFALVKKYVPELLFLALLFKQHLYIKVLKVFFIIIFKILKKSRWIDIKIIDCTGQSVQFNLLR